MPFEGSGLEKALHGAVEAAKVLDVMGSSRYAQAQVWHEVSEIPEDRSP